MDPATDSALSLERSQRHPTRHRRCEPASLIRLLRAPILVSLIFIHLHQSINTLFLFRHSVKRLPHIRCTFVLLAQAHPCPCGSTITFSLSLSPSPGITPSSVTEKLLQLVPRTRAKRGKFLASSDISLMTESRHYHKSRTL